MIATAHLSGPNYNSQASAGGRMDYSQALENMDMRWNNYLTLLVAATIGCCVLLPVAALVMFYNTVPPYLFYSLLALPLLLVAVIALLPVIQTANKKRRIDRDLPLFVAELATLSSTDMSFDRMMQTVAQKKEHGPLAEDAGRIYRLISMYDVSAVDACRFLSEHTPSEKESGLFLRLSHAIEQGEKLDRFFRSEYQRLMPRSTSH